MQERNQCETDTTNDQTDRISHLGILKLRQHNRPKHTTHSLNSKEDTYPVASLLECLGSRIGSIPNRLSNGTCRIIP